MATADPWRTLVGYGPGSIFVAFNPFYPAELTRLERGSRPDRLHNELLDVLVTTGVIGLATHLLLFSLIIYIGLIRLALVQTPKQKAAFLSAWLIGGLAGMVMPRLIEGTWRYAALGVSLGWTAALVVYLIGNTLQKSKISAETGREALLCVALLSALWAHFLETQVGVTVAATLTYSWLYAALLVSPVFSPDLSYAGKQLKRGTSKWGNALVMGLILIAGGFGLMGFFTLRPEDLVAPGLLLVVWLIGGLVFMGEGSFSNQDERAVGFSWLYYSLGAWGWFLLFLLGHRAMMRPGQAANLIVAWYLFLLVMLAVLAFVLMREGPAARVFWHGKGGWLYPFLVLAMLLIIWITNINTTRADMYYRAGLTFQGLRRYDQAVALYRQATRLAPFEDHYYLAIGIDGRALMEQADNLPQRTFWFEESRKALQRAIALNPLEPNHFVALGHLYLRWGETIENPQERVRSLVKALEYYQRVRHLAPQTQGPEVIKDFVYTLTLLGDTYMMAGALDQAMTAYQQASRLAPEDYRPHKKLAILYQQLGRLKEALAQAEQAFYLAPKGEKDVIHNLIQELQSSLR